MAVPVPGFLGVSEVIRLAVEQGCEVKVPLSKIITPWGKLKVRYIYNPVTGGTFDISDFEDDETMSPSSVRAAERRLSITLLNSGPRH